MSKDLDEAQQRLREKLGSNYNVYMQLLGRWFRGMISKEEFDKNAKHLVKEHVLEHNKFFLALFQHCVNNTSNSIQSHNFQFIDYQAGQQSGKQNNQRPTSNSQEPGDSQMATFLNTPKVRCLPDRLYTHMRIYFIAWEVGLNSVNENVLSYINLALRHFLKNIITDLVCTKTAYRLRENKFKHAIGVKPINPYLNNSLRIYTSNLEQDPYQIDSSRMNSSVLDTCVYSDAMFHERLYEDQALYEYACSTTSISSARRQTKRLKLSEIFLNQGEDYSSQASQLEASDSNLCELPSNEPTEEVGDTSRSVDNVVNNERRLTLFHLLIAFLTNRTIIPSQSSYSINLERIFTRLSC